MVSFVKIDGVQVQKMKFVNNFDKIKRFSQLQKKLELAEYLDVGDFGPTYFSDKYPDLLIKKFKGRDKISLLESWVNLYNEC